MGNIITSLAPAIAGFINIAMDSINKKESPSEFRARLARSDLVSDAGWQRVIDSAHKRDDFVDNG